MEEFPHTFQILKLREIEDILCIYKSKLGADTNGSISGKSCYVTDSHALANTCVKMHSNCGDFEVRLIDDQAVISQGV